MNRKQKKRPSGLGNVPVHDPLSKEQPRKDDRTSRQAEVLDSKRIRSEFDHRKTDKP